MFGFIGFKHNLLLIALSLTMMFTSAATLGCNQSDAEKNNEPYVDSKATPPPPPPDVISLGLNELTIDKLILEQIISYFPPSENGIEAFKSNRTGGVLLNAKHGPSPENFKKNVEAFNHATDNSVMMPFFTIDQEGGKIARISEGIKIYPTNREIAKRGAIAFAIAAEEGLTFGAVLRKCGIHINFAPVLDVATDAEGEIIGALGRSYGDDPKLVGELGLEFVNGLQYEGVLAVLKHFPGHGMVSQDSHKELPYTNAAKEEIMATHVAPFQFVIENAKNGIDFVMVSHVLYTELDSENPASLSEKIIGGLLRGELEYKGIVVSDALGMSALSGTLPERTLSALRAGCDMVILDPGLESQIPDIVKFIAANYSDEDVTRTIASLNRIIIVKDKLGLINETTS